MTSKLGGRERYPGPELRTQGDSSLDWVAKSVSDMDELKKTETLQRKDRDESDKSVRKIHGTSQNTPQKQLRLGGASSPSADAAMEKAAMCTCSNGRSIRRRSISRTHDKIMNMMTQAHSKLEHLFSRGSDRNAGLRACRSDCRER